jgi:hypothetical protein
MTKGKMSYECKYGHMDQEGARIEEDQEKHTSRGSKLMNLVVCI